MHCLIEMLEDGVATVLKTILYPILLFKIWLEELFSRTPENENEFVTLEMIYYIDDECEGYVLDAKLYGVTSWQVIMDALSAKYDVMDGSSDARLDIRYQVMGQKYHIVYQRGADPHIVYPPYTIEELRDFMNSSTSLLSIIHAERNNVDITDQVAEYMGPKGNFYSDLDIVIKGDWILDPSWGSKGAINITDGECNDYIFPGVVPLSLEGDEYILSDDLEDRRDEMNLPPLIIPSSSEESEEEEFLSAHEIEAVDTDDVCTDTFDIVDY